MPARTWIVVLLATVTIACGGCGEDRSHLTVGRDLGLHCSATSQEIRQRLGEPTKEIAGLDGYDKDLREEGAEMGLAAMVYKDLGIRIDLRHGRAYYVGVSEKYRGTFHGFQVGSHISDIIDELGLPYGDTATPERAIKVDLTRDEWIQDGHGDRSAYYLVDTSPTHYFSFFLDRDGVVQVIYEEDNEIRGSWYLMPRH